MCPDCIVAKAGLLGGHWIALFISALFFGIAVFAIVWAVRSGQFEDMEAAKYQMLEDERPPES